MNKTGASVVLIVAVVALLGVLIYSSDNRFSIATSPDGTVYRVDRRTGNTERISPIPTPTPSLLPDEPPPDINEEEAIRLAQAAETMMPGSFQNNAMVIREWLERQTGELRIIGWKATQWEPDTYVVTFSVNRGEGLKNFAFEVHLGANLVRNIHGDEELDKKYGFSQ